MFGLSMMQILFIGLLLLLAIIFKSISDTRNQPLSGKNKIACLTIAVLQAVHLVLFFSRLLAIIAEYNIMIAFLISATISLVCLFLSMWLILPFAKFKSGKKYLMLLLSVGQILVVVVLFLLPEPGISAPIQLF